MSQSVRAQVRELLNIATSNKPQEGYTDARQWFEDRVIILIADMLSGLEMEEKPYSDTEQITVEDAKALGYNEAVIGLNSKLQTLKAQLQEETK